MPELYQYEYDSDPDDSSSDYMEPHDPTPEEQEEMRPEDLQRLSHRRMLRRKWDRGTAHRLPLIQEMLDWLNISAKRLGSDDEGDLEDVVIRDDVGYLSLAVRNEQVEESIDQAIDAQTRMTEQLTHEKRRVDIIGSRIQAKVTNTVAKHLQKSHAEFTVELRKAENKYNGLLREKIQLQQELREVGEALGARESQLTDMRIQMRDPEALLQALIGFSRAQLEDALYKLATKDLDLETIKDVVAPLTEHLPPPKLLSPRGHRRSISASGPHGCCALSPRSKMGQFTQHILSLDSQLSATRDELAATTRYWHEAVEHNYKLQEWVKDCKEKARKFTIQWMLCDVPSYEQLHQEQLAQERARMEVDVRRDVEVRDLRAQLEAQAVQLKARASQPPPEPPSSAIAADSPSSQTPVSDSKQKRSTRPISELKQRPPFVQCSDDEDRTLAEEQQLVHQMADAKLKGLYRNQHSPKAHRSAHKSSPRSVTSRNTHTRSPGLKAASPKSAAQPKTKPQLEIQADPDPSAAPESDPGAQAEGNIRAARGPMRETPSPKSAAPGTPGPAPAPGADPGPAPAPQSPRPMPSPVQATSPSSQAMAHKGRGSSTQAPIAPSQEQGPAARNTPSEQRDGKSPRGPPPSSPSGTSPPVAQPLPPDSLANTTGGFRFGAHEGPPGSPSTRNSRPDTRSSRPDTRGSRPDTRGSRPGTRGSRCPRPETRGSDRGSRTVSAPPGAYQGGFGSLDLDAGPGTGTEWEVFGGCCPESPLGGARPFSGDESSVAETPSSRFVPGAAPGDGRVPRGRAGPGGSAGVDRLRLYGAHGVRPDSRASGQALLWPGSRPQVQLAGLKFVIHKFAQDLRHGLTAPPDEAERAKPFLDTNELVAAVPSFQELVPEVQMLLEAHRQCLDAKANTRRITQELRQQLRIAGEQYDAAAGPLQAEVAALKARAQRLHDLWAAAEGDRGRLERDLRACYATAPAHVGEALCRYSTLRGAVLSKDRENEGREGAEGEGGGLADGSVPPPAARDGPCEGPAAGGASGPRSPHSDESQARGVSVPQGLRGYEGDGLPLQPGPAEGEPFGGPTADGVQRRDEHLRAWECPACGQRVRGPKVTVGLRRPGPDTQPMDDALIRGVSLSQDSLGDDAHAESARALRCRVQAVLGKRELPPVARSPRTGNMYTVTGATEATSPRWVLDQRHNAAGSSPELLSNDRKRAYVVGAPVPNAHPLDHPKMAGPQSTRRPRAKPVGRLQVQGPRRASQTLAITAGEKLPAPSKPPRKVATPPAALPPMTAPMPPLCLDHVKRAELGTPESQSFTLVTSHRLTVVTPPDAQGQDPGSARGSPRYSPRRTTLSPRPHSPPPDDRPPSRPSPAEEAEAAAVVAAEVAAKPLRECLRSTTPTLPQLRSAGPSLTKRARGPKAGLRRGSTARLPRPQG